MNGEPDLLIGGKWRHASDGGTREIVNPADGSVAAVVDEATPEDARDAVAAARKAFDDGRWPTTSVADRAAVLDRIADPDRPARSERLPCTFVHRTSCGCPEKPAGTPSERGTRS